MSQPHSSTDLGIPVQFSIVDGKLVVTFIASSFYRCGECEDFHLILLNDATPINLLNLAYGIVHLSGHLND